MSQTISIIIPTKERCESLLRAVRRSRIRLRPRANSLLWIKRLVRAKQARKSQKYVRPRFISNISGIPKSPAEPSRAMSLWSKPAAISCSSSMTTSRCIPILSRGSYHAGRSTLRRRESPERRTITRRRALSTTGGRKFLCAGLSVMTASRYIGARQRFKRRFE